MGGGVGVHILLQTFPLDLAMKFVGPQPAQFQLGFPWWCPLCSPRGHVQDDNSGGG
jgi:hypothetical protein